MQAEAISPVELEQEKSSLPTTLHLFRYKGLNLANLQERVSEGLQLEENFSRTELSLGKLHEARNARLDRLSETAYELSEQLDNSTSSISCGAVYLKMRDELSNLSPNDFMECFNLCLRFNTLSNEQITDWVSTKGEQAALLKSLSGMSARRIPAEYEKILHTIIPNPPEWFGKNKKSLANICYASWEFFCIS